MIEVRAFPQPSRFSHYSRKCGYLPRAICDIVSKNKLE